MTENAGAVLVIDDEPAILRAVGAALRARGYQLLTATTGERAVEIVAVDNPDVVVLDLGLPDVDGLDVCRRIRGWSSVPIIVLSAEGADERKVAALKCQVSQVEGLLRDFGEEAFRPLMRDEFFRFP